MPHPVWFLFTIIGVIVLALILGYLVGREIATEYWRAKLDDAQRDLHYTIKERDAYKRACT